MFVLLTISILVKCLFLSNLHLQNMGRPPEVSPGAASALVLRLFPFKHVSLNSFKQLPSYDDRNIYFEGIHEDKTELMPFVLKMSSTDLYTLELVDGLSKMMLFVESRGFVCSAPIASRTGQHSLMATEQELLGGKRSDGGEEVETVEYPVRVMRYIPGELMDKLDKCYLTPQLSYDVGNYVGRMDQALQVYAIGIYMWEGWTMHCRYISSMCIDQLCVILILFSVGVPSSSSGRSDL